MGTRPLNRSSLALSLVAAVLATFAATATSASAQAGLLDPTFAGSGQTLTGFQTQDDRAYAVAVQPDGKIIAVGNSYLENYSKFALARYNTDGSLDSTFGSGGKMFYDVGYSDTTANAVALQPDGKIVVAGTAKIGGDYDFVVCRFNADGSVDSTFNGVSGRRSFNFGNGGTDDDYANAVAVLPNGDILVAGSADSATKTQVALVRLTSTGGNTTGLNGSTSLTASIGDSNSAAYSIAFQPDGRFVVGGYSAGVSTGQDFGAARFNPDGSLDTSFGANHDGTASIAAGLGPDQANSVGIQPDGKIILAGGGKQFGNPRGTFIRLTPNGVRDSSFGTDGVKTPMPSPYSDGFSDMTVLQSGKIVVGGYWIPGPLTLSASMVARFTANGDFDPSFGTNGVTHGPAPNSGSANAVALAPDGKVVTAGEEAGTGGQKFAVARYLADPPPPIALSSTIAKSLKGKIKASKLKKITGTAAGDNLAKVQIALNLSDSKLLKKHKRCRFVTGHKGKTKKYKTTKKRKCGTPAKWLTANGTTSWSYKLTGKLKKGKYTLYVRALDTAGTAQAKPATRKFTIK
jgi:uncharacterized delta-60 repeat protein